MAAITADGRQELVALYLTMFGTGPTTVQLAAMVVARENGSTLAQVATTLSAETAFALVASKDADSFATYLADALLASDTPATARAWALNWVVTQVQGTKTKAQVIAEAVQAIRATTNTNYTTAQAALAADVTATLTAIDNPLVTGQTFTLTTGLDTGTLFTGSTGNDTFNAIDSNDTDTETLTDGDSLVGAGGSDTLNIAVASGSDGIGALITASGVETLSITQNRAAGYSIDASLMADLGLVKVTSGAGATTVTNAVNILNAEISNSNQNLTITPAASATEGTADASTLTLSGAGRTTSITVTNNGVETVNLALSGTTSGSTTVGSERTVTIASDELETVVVTGAASANLVANLTGADLISQVATFNASAATGNITASLTAGGSTKMSVSGGTGNDTFTVGALDTDYTVSGGDGTDTLVATAGAPVTGVANVGANVSGFERIKASGAGAVDLSSIANTTFVATVDGGTYSKAGAGIVNSYLTATGSLTLTRATDTAADALTVHLQGSADTTYATVSVANEETLAIVAGGNTSNVTHTITTLTATDATKLTVTGTNGLVITTLTGEEALATIDASAHTGKVFTIDASDSNVAMTVSGSVGAPSTETATVNTITTGSKNDSITGGEYIDSLVGGAGADTINAGGGNDTVDSGSGADVVNAGEGNNSVSGGSGDDSITAGAGNDIIDSGSGSDTVVAGGGNDMIIESSLSDDTSIDAGAGTDRLAEASATATTFNNTAASLETGFITVSDDAAPGSLAGVEIAYISIDAEASVSADDPVELDLTTGTEMTTLYLEVDNGEADFAKITNFKGSAVTLFGATTNGEEADLLTIDGAGQSSLTINLEAYVGADADEDITVTGAGSVTLASKSKSMFTGTATQDNLIDAFTANSASTLTITSSGSNSTTDGAAALTMGAVSASQASTVNVTAGAADVVTIASITTDGDEAENATITVTADGRLDLGSLDFGTSDMDTLTISVGDAAGFSTVADLTLTVSEDVTVTAASIGTLSITIGANSYSSLGLGGIDVAAGTLAIDTGATLAIDDNLGVDEGDSSFTFSGRGTLAVDDGTDITTASNPIVIIGDTATFNTTGLTQFTTGLLIDGALVEEILTVSLNTTIGGNDSVTGGAGNDSISTGSGADTILGGGGNDSITTGEGMDEVTGGGGNDTITLTETTSVADTLFFSAAASNGKDTISGFIVATDLLNLEQGTDDMDFEAAIAANAATTAGADKTIYVFADGSDGTGTEAIADYTDLTDVAAFLAAGLTEADAHVYTAVVNDLAGDKAYIYSINVDAVTTAANTIESGDITLVGIVNTATAVTVTDTVFTA